MNSRFRTFIGISLLTANASVTTAQAPPPPAPVGVPPARDNNAPATGTGRIRGRVVDAETGTPLMDTLLRLAGGNMRESPVAGTDDDGRFEFEDLPAGRYSLSANKPGYMTLSYGQRRPFENGRQIDLANNQTLEGIDFAVPRGGVIVAHVTDENGDPFPGVRIQAQRFRFMGAQRTLAPVAGSSDATDDRGEVRVFGLPPGDYYVAASMGPSSAAANGISYVTTYHPGTTSTDQAERVAVQVGKEVHVNFQLVAAKLARVSGVVRRADGSAGARASVLIAPRTSTGFIYSAAVQPDGTFSIPAVPPGDYQLQAQFLESPQAERQTARMPLTVAGRDVAGVTLAMTTGGTIQGRFVLDAPTPANFRFASLQPMLTAPPSPGVVLVSSGTPTTLDDGTFTLRNVVESGLVRVLSPPAGWYLKAVTLDGKDVTDVPIGLENRRELTGIEIVLTQKRAEINGRATTEKGTAVSDFAAVIFPEDRSLWTADSRFIATGRPDQQGRFRIQGLPPGKYLATAVEYIEAGSERDPEVLSRLRDRAIAVTVAEGEASTVTLTIQ